VSTTSRTARRRPTKRRLPRADREAQLIEIGLARFARDGFHGVSVDEIAAAAGVTKPIVYTHFGSKEGLFVACAEHAAERFADALRRSAARHSDPEQRMWYGCLEVFRFIEEHREAWAVLYMPDSPGGPFGGPAARATETMVALVSGRFSRTAAASGVAPAAAQHLEPMAYAFVHATIGLGRWWIDHPGEPAELQALRMMNFAWMGFGNLVKGTLWIPPPPGAEPSGVKRR
jgi:AcrR family transcriptional regulator